VKHVVQFINPCEVEAFERAVNTIVGYLTLPARMRAAAETLAEANALYGYQADWGLWNPASLRREADAVEEEVPQ